MRMVRKSVSVIIPCYNGEKVINRSIESVYMQAGEFVIELIVVDDGSTDKSKEQIDIWIPKFKKKGYKLKYIYQKNQGVGGAINKGLKYVTGEYLTLLDADDCFLQNSIKKRAEFLEENLEYVGVRTNGWQDKHGEKKLFEVNESGKDTNLFDGLIGGQATNWAGSYMIRTQELFEVYPTREIYPSRFGQNMQILLPLAYKRKFGFIDEPLMIYYLQNTSHSQAATPEERKKKEDLNFYGYRDIYLKMLNMIVKDQKEYNYYLNIIESWKCKHELQKAIFEKNKKQIRYYLKKYKSTGQMTLNEEIDFCTEVYPIKVTMLKIIRRIGIISGNSRRKRN